jgi:single-stranded DNA-binding protein
MYQQHITITGKLDYISELHQLESGDTFISISIATKQKTDWHKVNVFNNDANWALKNLKIGEIVLIKGTVDIDESTSSKSKQPIKCEHIEYLNNYALQ